MKHSVELLTFIVARLNSSVNLHESIMEGKRFLWDNKQILDGNTLWKHEK
jgi:hypothetical protein